jgi:hypothetical protein
MDITLDLALLEQAKAGPEAAIGEFDQATKTNDHVESAIKRPGGRGDLWNQAIELLGIGLAAAVVSAVVLVPIDRKNSYTDHRRGRAR